MAALKEFAKVKTDLKAVDELIDKLKLTEAETKLKTIKTNVDKIAKDFGDKKAKVDKAFVDIAKAIDAALAALDAANINKAAQEVDGAYADAYNALPFLK
ncbi:hypothetical protein AYO44_02515 [Planctomycetaceae bacterium SCGC AG-212-F19]|nr:hypothetical protein AYO44_02515 [Planctomycetaceae bacterium SCGC AG-212-F19]